MLFIFWGEMDVIVISTSNQKSYHNFEGIHAWFEEPNDIIKYFIISSTHIHRNYFFFLDYTIYLKTLSKMY